MCVYVCMCVCVSVCECVCVCCFSPYLLLFPPFSLRFLTPFSPPPPSLSACSLSLRALSLSLSLSLSLCLWPLLRPCCLMRKPTFLFFLARFFSLGHLTPLVSSYLRCLCLFPLAFDLNCRLTTRPMPSPRTGTRTHHQPSQTPTPSCPRTGTKTHPR